MIAGRSPVSARQTDRINRSNRKQDGRGMVEEYIRQNYPEWRSRRIGQNLQVTNSRNGKSVSLRVRRSRDYLELHCQKHHTVLGNHLMATGWWSIERQDIENPQADLWVFVLPSLSDQRISFIIIPPRELLQGLQRIHGARDRFDPYFWVTRQGCCWETRDLSRDCDRLIDNGTYSDRARDFRAFLNAWHLVEERVG